MLRWLLTLLACAPVEECPLPFDVGSMAEPASEGFHDFVDAHLVAMEVPGAGIAVIRDGALYWEGGVGVADTVTRDPVRADTLFMLASISKLFTATAVLLLWEDGAFELDEDVNGALPFRLEHPDAPDAPITYRQLLQHRSGIRDDDFKIWSNYVRGDSEEALGDYLTSYLEPGGSRYDAALNFGPPPGADYRYSNIGFALLGWLVELHAGEPFDAFCQRRIFAPLGLEDAGWFLRDVDEQRVAHPSVYGAGAYFRGAHYGYPDYPDGQLRITPGELAAFLIAWHPDAGPREAQLPTRPTVTEAWLNGLTWKFYPWGDEQAAGHGGSDRGVHTQARIGRESADGFVVLLNAKMRTEAQEAHRDCLLSGVREAARAE